MANLNWQLAGLLAYLACAILFVIGGIRAGDFVSIAGSILFFVGAASFLTSHYKSDGKHDR